jgi:hypothetical protein
MFQPNKEPKVDYNTIILKTRNTHTQKKECNSNKSYLKLSKDYQKRFCPKQSEHHYK